MWRTISISSPIKRFSMRRNKKVALQAVFPLTRNDRSVWLRVKSTAHFSNKTCSHYGRYNGVNKKRKKSGFDLQLTRSSLMWNGHEPPTGKMKKEYSSVELIRQSFLKRCYSPLFDRRVASTWIWTYFGLRNLVYVWFHNIYNTISEYRKINSTMTTTRLLSAKRRRNGEKCAKENWKNQWLSCST